jgi:diguanylate cyclase (GGDEF)-like protein/PAS domain S-box-containing protein
MSLSALQQGDTYEFHAFIADISQRKLKEDKLIELQSQLTRSESLYRLLTEDALDVIWRTDRHLRLTYISPADQRLRGFRSDEVIGQSVLSMFTDEGARTVKQLMRAGRGSPRVGLTAEFMNFDVQHRCKDGRVLWGEVLAKPERDPEGVVTGYHGITREITQRKQLEDQVRQLAFFDPLTQLPNRRLLTDRLAIGLASSLRTGHHGALMFLDLDNFKTLNDVHGHAMGDLLLIEVAARLKACVRAVDTVSRFGGDEFVVLLGELETDHGHSLAQARAIAEKIRVSLSLPYQLTAATEGPSSPVIEHRCTASIGVKVFAHGTASQDEILKGADAAMYRAKDGGRNTIRFAEPLESAEPGF